jgi:hypothetical protein
VFANREGTWSRSPNAERQLGLLEPAGGEPNAERQLGLLEPAGGEPASPGAPAAGVCAWVGAGAGVGAGTTGAAFGAGSPISVFVFDEGR